jgi:hypothetical protein
MPCMLFALFAPIQLACCTCTSNLCNGYDRLTALLKDRCVRGYITLATLSMEIMAFFILVPLRLFARLSELWPVPSGALVVATDDKVSLFLHVLPSSVANHRAFQMSEGRSKEGCPIQSNHMKEHQLEISAPSTEQLHSNDESYFNTFDQFSTTPEKTPTVEDFQTDTASEHPYCDFTPLPGLSASSSLDVSNWATTPERDSSEAFESVLRTPSSIKDLAPPASDGSKPPCESEPPSNPETCSESECTEDDLYTLVQKLEALNLNPNQSEPSPTEPRRPVVRTLIEHKGFAPSQNPGLVAPPTTLTTIVWEKAVLEAWFSSLRTANFHQTFQRNLALLRYGKVAGRLARVEVAGSAP